jgi:hypothetical protein
MQCTSNWCAADLTLLQSVLFFTATNKIYVMVQFTDLTYTQQQLCCICLKQNQSKEKHYEMKKPPVNPLPRPYLRVMW